MSAGGGEFTPGRAAAAVVTGGLTEAPNMLGELSGANRMAAIQKRMAEAQLAQQSADRQLALSYAEASPEELQQLQQAIQLNSQDVARKQKLLDSSDPAMIEAGKQALALMQGKQAASVEPLQRDRQAQRQKLESQLSARLGPDYAQSSAGIQALNQFDQQTADLSNQVQQQTLAQFMGYTQNAQQFGNMQPNIGNSQNFGQLFGNIGTRKANAVTGNRIDAQLAYAGDLASARAYNQSFGQLMQVGGMVGGAMLGGGLGAMAGGKAAGLATGPAQPSAGQSYTDYSGVA